MNIIIIIIIIIFLISVYRTDRTIIQFLLLYSLEKVPACLKYHEDK